MLHLSLENAPYSEMDFAKFNSEGFRRISTAIEMAQQTRALAQDTDDLAKANSALRAAGERRHLEQQIAQKNFEAERKRAFDAVKPLIDRFKKMIMPPPRRLEIENRLDHLITLFNMKDFGSVRREATSVAATLDRRPSFPPTHPIRNWPQDRGPKPPVPPQSQSVTALFQRGLSLERAGRLRQAVETYGRVLERNPNHLQAKKRLSKINGFARRARL
jgi:hypothetical protein